MKTTAAVLHWLVLVPLTLSHDTCYRKGQALYYIYNANVKINSYYCLLSDGTSTSCENFYNGKKVTNGCQDILRKCRQKREEVNINIEVKVTLCEVPARVNLLENTITLATNKTCKYDMDNCYDAKLKKYVFWYYKEICQNLVHVYNGNVDVWTIGQNRMFIRSSLFSLLLKNKTVLCGVDVWNTRHDGIVVSTNDIKNSLRGNLLKFDDILPKICIAEADNNKGTKISLSYDETSVQNIWYIYTYFTNVTVYYCIPNYRYKCKHLEYDEISQTQQQKLLETCKNKFSFIYDSSLKVCQKTQTVDLMKNKIQGLHSKCTYSFGICPDFKAFWIYTDPCTAIQKMYEGYEVKRTYKTRTVHITNSFELTLFKQGKLCDKPVWYTNPNGFVASPKKLQFFQSNPVVFREENIDRSPEISQETETIVENMPNNNHDHLLTSEDEFHLNSNTAVPLFFDQIDDNRISSVLDIQYQEINHLQNLLYCLMFLVLVWILWYVVNVMINFISLKKFNETQISKSRAYLLNSVSQSLTVRYLFINEKKMTTQERGVPDMNESVDNELYDMQLTKFK